MEGPAVKEPVKLHFAKDMTDVIFCKHMTLRHGESLGGLPILTAMPGTIRAWRSFHDHLHRLARPGQYNHVHVVKSE